MTTKARLKAGVASFIQTVVGVVIGVFLSVILFAILSSAPGHDEMYERQAAIEAQVRYISCLLLVPPEDRTPDVVSECQVPDP